MYEYSEGDGRWIEAPTRAGPLEVKTLRVATFNVWFDAFERELSLIRKQATRQLRRAQDGARAGAIARGHGDGAR